MPCALRSICVRDCAGIRPALRIGARDGVYAQHTATSATEAAGSPLSGTHVEHEKKTFFSLLQNSRSGAVSQGRAFCARSSERSGEPLRTAQRRLPRGSASARLIVPRSFASNRFPQQQPQVTPAATVNRLFST